MLFSFSAIAKFSLSAFEGLVQTNKQKNSVGKNCLHCVFLYIIYNFYLKVFSSSTFLLASAMTEKAAQYCAY